MTIASAASPRGPQSADGESGPAGQLGALLEVWRLAWPAIGHMLLLTLVFAVDRLVLGRTSTDALASLQISTVFVWTVTSVFTAFSAGTLAVAGRAFGAGDRPKAARVVVASLGLALVIGVVVGVVTLVLSPSLLALAFPNAGRTVLADSQRYLVILLPALPLVFVEATAASALQAAGDTRTPLVGAALSNVLNLAVSCVLVFGLLGAPQLGVLGAALGALCATTLQAAVLLVALFGRASALPLRAELTARSLSRSIIRPLLEVSAPAFADKMVYAGGYLVFCMIIGWLGPQAMAANQALVSVEAICFLSAEGVGIAAGSLVAQNLGAGRPQRAAQVARVAAAMAVALLSTFGLLFAAAPQQLLGIFSDDRSIVELATMSLIVAAIAQPFMAYAMVMRMALRGAGATGKVLLVSLAGTFLVRLPVSYAAAVLGGWGLLGVWLGSTLDWVFQALLFAWIFRPAGRARAPGWAPALALQKLG